MEGTDKMTTEMLVWPRFFLFKDGFSKLENMTSLLTGFLNDIYNRA